MNGKCKVCHKVLNDSNFKKHTECFEEFKREVIEKHLMCLKCAQLNYMCPKCNKAFKKLGML